MSGCAIVCAMGAQHVWNRIKQNPTLVAGIVVSIGMSIYSFINAYETYLHLVEVKEDYSTLIEHWESKPLIDVILLPFDRWVPCPDGYDQGIVANNNRKVDQTIGEWPGKKAWCDCRPQGFDWTFSYTEQMCDCGSGKCTTKTNSKGESKKTCYYSNDWGDGSCSYNADNAGCTSKSRPATKTVTYFTGSGDCHTNATKAGCRTDERIRRKPLESWREHRVCYKRGGWSAMQRIDKLTDDLANCTEGVICQSAQNSQDDTYTICAPDKETCPLTSLGSIDHISSKNHNFTKIRNGNNPNLNLTFSSLDDKNNIPQKRPIVDIRTTIGYPCWKGTFGQKGRSNNQRIENKFDTNCNVDDTRFIFWDNLNEPTLLNENEIPVSGNHLLGDNRRSPYQYFNESFDVNWTISYRNEIYWKSDCKVGNVKALSWNLKPLKQLTTLELTLVVMNCIFGLIILGIALPILTCMHILDIDNDLSCIPGEGKEELQNINRGKTVMKIISTLGKFTPLIISVVVTDQVNWFFSNVGQAKCSDDLTNDTMLDIGNEVARIKEGNQRNLIIDSILFVWTTAMLIKEMYCAKKNETENQTNQAANENNVNLEIGNNNVGKEMNQKWNVIKPQLQTHSIQPQNVTLNNGINATAIQPNPHIYAHPIAMPSAPLQPPPPSYQQFQNANQNQ